jgi:hypothetical protein
MFDKETICSIVGVVDRIANLKKLPAGAMWGKPVGQVAI